MSKFNICVLLSGVFGGIFTLVLLISLSTSELSSLHFFEWINSHLEELRTIGSLAVALSAFTALALYATTVKRYEKEDAHEQSKAMLNEYKNLLEKSYELFINHESSTCMPRQNRLAWLTVARMLKRAESFRLQVSDKTHRQIASEGSTPFPRTV